MRSFATAIERRDFQAAYDWMSSEYRGRVSCAEFRRSLLAQEREVGEVIPSLRRAASDSPLRVEVRVTPEVSVPLVRESAGWRVDDQPFDFLHPKTPRAAVRAFLIALERKDYERLLYLAPADRRGALDASALQAYWEGERAAQHQKFLADLRRSWEATVVQDGDRAFLPLQNGGELLLSREDGVWKVEASQ